MRSPSIPNNRSGAWTIIKVLHWTTSYFNSHGIENGRVDAEILLAHALKLRRIDLYLSHDRPLCSDELEIFKSLIKRRTAREPVAFIVGRKEFWSHSFNVSEGVLIPRPETECLVETALKIIGPSDSKKRLRILELGTGSGAIVISLASEVSSHLYFATDLSMAAIEVAAGNARRILPSGIINWVVGDWFDAFQDEGRQFDLIVSNPPYIRKETVGNLQPEICQYEPIMALDGGGDGLDCYRRIIPAAMGRLSPGGYLLLEIGFDQKEPVRHIASSCRRYESVSFKKDYSGHDRVAILKLLS